MSPRQKKDISDNLSKALATRVTDSVKEEIAHVVNDTLVVEPIPKDFTEKL